MKKLKKILAQIKTMINHASVDFVTFNIDVSNLDVSAVESLAALLNKYLAVHIRRLYPTFRPYTTTIFAFGFISAKHYNDIWRALDSLPCIVFC